MLLETDTMATKWNGHHQELNPGPLTCLIMCLAPYTARLSSSSISSCNSSSSSKSVGMGLDQGPKVKT